METPDLSLTVRPRRLRLRAELRRMLQTVNLRRRDIIVPVFVCEGEKQNKPVASMPGVSQMSVDVAADWLTARAKEGFASCLLFGVIESHQKDDKGSAALDETNVVCRLLREIKARQI